MIEFGSSRLKTFFIESMIFNNDWEVACCQWKSSRSACRTYDLFLFSIRWASRKTCPRLKRIHPRFLYPFRPNCLVPSVRPASSVRLSPPLASFSEKRRLEDRWRRDRTFFCHGEVQKCRLIGGERSRSFCQYLFWSWLNQEFSYLYLYFYDCI